MPPRLIVPYRGPSTLTIDVGDTADVASFAATDIRLPSLVFVATGDDIVREGDCTVCGRPSDA